MIRRAALVVALVLCAAHAHAAVAIGTGTNTTSAAPATGSTFTSASWTLTAPTVIVVAVSIDSTTATVSSTSWSLGSGTSTCPVVSARSGTAYKALCCIANPTAGAGTYTVNLSASVPYQITATYFIGSSTTTPCAVGDTWTSTSTAAAVTSAVLNLTANDATYASGASTVAGNFSSATPNQTFINTTTSVNALSGYSTGTTQVVMNNDGFISAAGYAAVRIAMTAAGGVTPRMSLMGVGP